MSKRQQLPSTRAVPPTSRRGGGGVAGHAAKGEAGKRLVLFLAFPPSPLFFSSDSCFPKIHDALAALGSNEPRNLFSFFFYLGCFHQLFPLAP